ncbi:MAG: hypothetical protein HN978_18945 [Desulfobacula sp.]|jgi:hypothetical protein|nr:hypothetical protein [Desulfobacula sp.]MBT7051730.1 hypothetical protein [Desulfobacula sp.]
MNFFNALYQIFKKRSRDSKWVIKGLIETAKKWGANPKEWYVVYEDVRSLTSFLLKGGMVKTGFQ